MTLAEFLAKVRSEPPRCEEREVSVPAPELPAELRQRPVRVSEFLADPRHTIEHRTYRTGHVLGEAITAAELAAWFAAWPAHRLPLDLIALLERVDGIHLWADLDTGRSYVGLAPLREWQLARTAMWGEHADPDLLSDRYLALSYHQDSAAFVVLRVDTGSYFLMDSCGADESCLIGTTVHQLLDWLWAHRIP